ncbi:hypothetical protein AK830_g4048 [Neonectria ditissima]|uniref:Sulfotransferase domain-containing protein n=1 Tax=Neonectria ditissima TaxID=78410 RepID=A0A0P7BP83_9HYPO|nr:hypothetical protein AK830_g4048 [Neonectria ditissima]
MARGSESTQHRHYWLLTSPRTASNLLVKMLNLDEQGVRPAHMGGYFFIPAAPMQFKLQEKPMDTWTDEERTSLHNLHQECFHRLQDHIDEAERQGQKLFVKEHTMILNSPYFEARQVYGVTGDLPGEPKTLDMRGVQHPSRSPLNLTVLPDEFLKIWHPTFLIRHPAMMLPSLFRTCLCDSELNGFTRAKKEPMAAEVTMKWFRTLYDFYTVHFEGDSHWPIVLDADDVMTNPALVSKYAELAGLDSNKVRFSWEKASEDKLKKLQALEQRMLSTINATEKVDNSKVAGNVDIDDEAAKWRSEFGENEGRKLEQWVRNAMPDYHFLYTRRLRLE